MKTVLRKALPLLLCLILCIFLAPAAWADGYTITFDPNGGYGSITSQTVYPGQTAMLNPNTFSRANYVFSHWNTRPDGSGESYADQGDITPTGSLTLFAQWVKTSYSVYYNKNGGGGSMTPDSISKWSSGTVKANTFNSPNYSLTFGEWNTRPDGSGTSYQPGDRIWSDSVPSDITLYAIWRDKLDIWFYPGSDATGTTTTEEAPKDSIVSLPAPGDLVFKAHSGKTFAGWSLGDGTTLYKAGQKVVFGDKDEVKDGVVYTTSRSVYANWADTIKISYHPNGGTVTTSSGTKSDAAVFSAPKDTPYTLYTQDQLKLTRSGYEFKGWALIYSAKVPKEGWEADKEPITVEDGFSQNTTIYAVWEQKVFIGSLRITGGISNYDTVGYMGEELKANVTGDKHFEVDHYQWYRDGIAIEGETGQTYRPTSLEKDFETIITCDVWLDGAEGNPYHSENSKFIYADTAEKRIVNNGQVESDYVYGLYDGMYVLTPSGRKERITLTSASYPVTESGTYRFYVDGTTTTPFATVDVINWWTIGYNLSTGSSSDSSGSGTVTFKRGSTTLSGSTTIYDDSGTKTEEHAILKPYSLSGYTNVWIVRQDAGITDITMTVKPSSGSSSQVSLNGGSYSSSSAERVFNLGTIYSPNLYDVVFIRSGWTPKYDTGLFLPASLTEIEPEAFAGGSFNNVRVPAGVEKIGSRAFADCPNLKYIDIQGLTTEIAPDAFYGTYGITICAPFDSSAAAFAKEHGIAFIATS